jgi:hypothetical protein
MKISVKTLSMVLAIVLSVAVAPAAWSADFILIPDLTGTVVECEPGISTRIQIEIEGTTYSVYGLGPASYWEDQGVVLPEVGETITISVFEVEYADGTIKYVAQSVTVGSATIVLRDPDTGVPVWRQNKAAAQIKGNR